MSSLCRSKNPLCRKLRSADPPALLPRHRQPQQGLAEVVRREFTHPAGQQADAALVHHSPNVFTVKRRDHVFPGLVSAGDRMSERQERLTVWRIQRGKNWAFHGSGRFSRVGSGQGDPARPVIIESLLNQPDATRRDPTHDISTSSRPDWTRPASFRKTS